MTVRCDIFGAGGYYGGFEPCGSLIIAADGGLDHLRRLNINADVIIGDFDSSTEPEADHILLPRVKDDTDMLAAIKIGVSRGCTVFHLWGGTGGSRSDHTAANIQCIVGLSRRGFKAYLHGDAIVTTAITDCVLTFDGTHSGYISVFSASDVSTGVNLRGLKYPLENAALTNDLPLGVSNEFTGVSSSVEVERGTLVVYYGEAGL